MRYSDFASSAPKNGKKKQSSYNYSTIKAKDTNPNIKKEELKNKMKKWGILNINFKKNIATHQGSQEFEENNINHPIWI